jgi:signal recognition particle GTPase
MRVMRDVFESFLQMGPMSQVFSMIPGFDAAGLGGMLGQGGDKASQVCCIFCVFLF